MDSPGPKDVLDIGPNLSGVLGERYMGVSYCVGHYFHICLNTYVGFCGVFCFVLSFDSYGLFVCSVEKDVMELREGSLEVSLPLKAPPTNMQLVVNKAIPGAERTVQTLTFYRSGVAGRKRGFSSNVREAERGETCR